MAESKQHTIFFAVLFITFFMVLNFFPFAQEIFAEDKILAVVNNEIITQKDLNDFLQFMQLQMTPDEKTAAAEKLESIKYDLLERLIEDRLILQEAKKENVNIDKNQIKNRVTQIKSRYPTEQDFQNALGLQGLTQADLEKRISEQALIYRIIDNKVKKRIVINPQEVTDFYQQHQHDFLNPEQREVLALVLDKPDLTKQVRDLLKKGESDFNKVANEFSLKVENLGVIKKGELKKEIDDAVFRLGLNQNSGIINLEGKDYIFNIKRIIPPFQPDLKEISGRIYDLLFEKKIQEGVKKWLATIKESAYVRKN